MFPAARQTGFPSEHSPAGAWVSTAKVRIAAVGDVGESNDVANKVADAIISANDKEPVDRVLLLGDLIYARGAAETYDSRFAPTFGRLYGHGIITSAVLGNHDVMTDTEGIMAKFQMPARYYSFILKGIQFIALDDASGSIDEAQSVWVQRELLKSYRYRIVFMHIPLYSSGLHGDSAVLQHALSDLFDRRGVELVLAGHDHDYQRLKPIGSTTNVVSGGGCCVRKIIPTARTAFASSAPSFVIVEIDVASETLKLQAITSEGAVMDEAILQRPSTNAA